LQKDAFLVKRSDGVLWGWGDNGAGQIGDGTNGDSNTPIQVGTWCAIINVDAVNEMRQQTLKIYPNPARGVIHVEGAESYNLEVYNIIGELILRAMNSNEIDLSYVDKGIYLLKVITPDQHILSKIIIQ